MNTNTQLERQRCYDRKEDGTETETDLRDPRFVRSMLLSFTPKNARPHRSRPHRNKSDRGVSNKNRRYYQHEALKRCCAVSVGDQWSKQ